MHHDKQNGFTLIELMIVVAIIGILASLAISSYETYTVRAQVSDGIRTATSAKTSIAEAFYDRREAPPTRLASGMTEFSTDTTSNYVTEVEVENGRIGVTFGHNASLAIAGSILYLTPYEDVGGNVIWRCGNAPEPVGTGLMGATGTGNVAVYAASTVEDRYMPSACRP